MPHASRSCRRKIVFSWHAALSSARMAFAKGDWLRGRAHPSHGWGRWFKSSIAHQTFNRPASPACFLFATCPATCMRALFTPSCPCSVCGHLTDLNRFRNTPSSPFLHVCGQISDQKNHNGSSTSQSCSVCGQISDHNRPGKDLHCVACSTYGQISDQIRGFAAYERSLKRIIP